MNDRDAAIREAARRIVALCENPHWTADRRWRIDEHAGRIIKLLDGEDPDTATAYRAGGPR